MSGLEKKLKKFASLVAGFGLACVAITWPTHSYLSELEKYNTKIHETTPKIILEYKNTNKEINKTINDLFIISSNKALSLEQYASDRDSILKRYDSLITHIEKIKPKYKKELKLNKEYN